MTAPTAPITRCRVLDRNDNRCTGEVVDEVGELMICSRHLTAAMLLLGSHGYEITPPRKAAR